MLEMNKVNEKDFDVFNNRPLGTTPPQDSADSPPTDEQIWEEMERISLTDRRRNYSKKMIEERLIQWLGQHYDVGPGEAYAHYDRLKGMFGQARH